MYLYLINLKHRVIIMDNVEAKNLSEEIEKINLLGNASLIYTGNKYFDETYIYSKILWRRLR